MKLSLLKKCQRSSKQENQLSSDEIKHQNEYLTHWYQAYCKQNRFSRNRDKYPWYLLIGSQQSGKTALLSENSDFTQLMANTDKDANVVCWFNQQAVIIEPNGTLIEQKKNKLIPLHHRQLWKNLLHWIVKTRFRQPINGIILTLDINELLVDSPQEKTDFFKTISIRLREISAIFNAQLPIYIVVTKLDLLNGFKETYQTLGEEQQKNILGVTFSLSDIQKWQQEFDTFMQQWINNLNQALPELMRKNKSDTKQRGSIFSFTREINAVTENLLPLLQQISSLTHNKHPAFILRGAYFTSSLQQGQVTDLFLKTVSGQYQLPDSNTVSHHNEPAKNYFGDKLVNSHLFSEPHIASENKAFAAKHRFRVNFFAILTCVVALILVINWHYFYSINYNAGQLIKTKLANVNNIEQTTNDSKTTDESLRLSTLDYIASTLAAYEVYSQHQPLFPEIGIKQRHNLAIEKELRRFYLNNLKTEFLPIIMNELLQELNKSPEKSGEKLVVLRVMRMIEDESGRNNTVIFDYMSHYWANRYPEQDNLRTSLTKHLQYMLENFNWKQERDKGDTLAISLFEPYKESIRKAQQELRDVSFYEKIYANLKENASHEFSSELNLRSKIGAGYDFIFTVNNEELLYIPRLFTKQIFDKYLIKQSNQLAELTATDDWILNISTDHQSNQADYETMKQNIMQLYLKDYLSTWLAAYDNLHIQNFDDIILASAALEQIIGKEQPLTAAITLLKDNALPPITSSMVDNNNNTEQQTNNNIAATIEKTPKDKVQTSDLTALQERYNTYQKQLDTINTIMPKLVELHEYLQAMSQSSTSDNDIIKQLQLRISNKKGDLIGDLQNIAKITPNPLGRWLTEMTGTINKLTNDDCIGALERQWEEQVIKPYKATIANRYPFNTEAKQDVNIADFNRFFAPNGILDKFNEKYLVFFKKNQSSLAKLGKNYQINKSVFQQINYANKIRRTFFKAKNKANFQFAIQPLTMSANKNLAILDFSGQRVTLKRNVPEPEASYINWPDTDSATSQSRLILTHSESNTMQNISFKGPWALFRMIDAGKQINKEKNTIKIRYDIDAGYIAYRVFIDVENNPFADKLFSQFKLPESLF